MHAMHFRSPLREDTPEINLIPLIDVLLVVLIFLAASTAFTRTAQLQLALPQAQKQDEDTAPQVLMLAISQDGQYALGDQWLPGQDLDALVDALRSATQDQSDLALTIYADANSAHARVVLALQAARAAGIARIRFATQHMP